MSSELDKLKISKKKKNYKAELKKTTKVEKNYKPKKTTSRKNYEAEKKNYTLTFDSTWMRAPICWMLIFLPHIFSFSMNWWNFC